MADMTEEELNIIIDAILAGMRATEASLVALRDELRRKADEKTAEVVGELLQGESYYQIWLKTQK